MSESQGFAIQCDRCHKLLLDCKCHLADLRPSHAVCASCFRVAARCDCPDFVSLLAKAAPAKPKAVPLPTPFSCTVPTRVGRRMTGLLIDQRVPFAVEYLRGEILLAVPRTFAVVLTAAQATAETDLAAGLFPGGDQ